MDNCCKKNTSCCRKAKGTESRAEMSDCSYPKGCCGGASNSDPANNHKDSFGCDYTTGMNDCAGRKNEDSELYNQSCHRNKKSELNDNACNSKNYYDESAL